MDIGSLIGGVVGGIGSIVGSSIGSKNALKATRETNQANRELAEFAYQQDLDMWNRQNVYNSPIEQMQRLKDAGLNPNLMYGQGNTGNASGMPSYDAPKMEAYTGFGDYGASRAGQQLMEGIQGYASIKKTEAETANIRQNTQNMEVQKNLAELQIIQQGLLNAKSKYEVDNWMDLYKSKLANIDSSTINNFASAQLHDSQRFYTDAQKERFEALTPLVIDSVNADLNQKLYDLNVLSPAKLRNLNADSNYKSVISKLSNIKSQLLFNELEYSNLDRQYYNEHVINKLAQERYGTEIKQIEKELSRILRDYGVKPGMSIDQIISTIVSMPILRNN